MSDEIEPRKKKRAGLLGLKPLTLAEVEARREANQQKQRAYIEGQMAKAEQLRAQLAEAGLLEGSCDPPRPTADSELGPDAVDIPVNSIEGSVGYGSLIRAMFEAGRRRVAFYRSPGGGNLSPEEAWAATYRNEGDPEMAQIILENILSYPFDCISFAELTPLATVAPRLAEQVWERIKDEAQAEFESGHRAARALTSVPHRREAWEVACFMGLRESFAEQWGVKGGIDAALIDMLAQAFWMVQFWTKEVDTRMQERPREEDYRYTQWKQQRKIEAKQWGEGWWDIPYITEQQAIDHATAQVEKWNRMFLRTLRNLRDLRRYAPVTINNPQQVNIAADGGQQVNVAKQD
jgi:hypothetical protein